MTKELKTILSHKGTYAANDMENYSEISPGKIKSAILYKTPFYYMPLFDLLEQKDTSIGSECDKRAMSTENKFFTTDFPKYDESAEEIIKASVHARIFGISLVELYIDENGDFAFSMVPREYYNFDEENKIYLKSGKNKIFPKEPNFYIIRAKPVLLKTLWIAYAKHFVLSHYLKFAEFLGVPPIIANAHSSEKDTISSISLAIRNLKSGGYAVLGENDLLKVLEGRGNQSDFMEFVKYCDAEIAKVINGASLGSNISKNGSYAQSKSHEENRFEIVKGDIKFATRITKILFRKIDISINLNIQIEKDIDLLKRAQTLEILKTLGYELTNEQIAYEFDLPAPSLKKENNKRKFSFNSKLAKDNIDLALEDDIFEEELQKSEDEILQEIQKVLRDSRSYEDAYEKLVLNYKNIEFKKMDELLFKAISMSELRGVIND